MEELPLWNRSTFYGKSLDGNHSRSHSDETIALIVAESTESISLAVHMNFIPVQGRLSKAQQRFLHLKFTVILRI